MSFILGLDVGTAAGASATKRDGYVQPCRLGERSCVLPSTVVLHDDGSFLTGEEAARAGGVELVRVARDLRRDPMLQADPLVGGSQVSTPYAMLRALHASMVEDVCRQSSDVPTHVVVTHPALPEGLRCDVVERIASELFPGALLVPAPVAATVKLACDCVLPSEGNVAVYDFGGGTIDLSLVRRDGDRFSTLGEPSGMSDFGGIDVDDMLLSYVDSRLGGALAELDLSDPAAMATLTRLRAECRTAKERLSYEAEVTIDASLAGEPDLLTVRRHEFEELLFPRLDESIDALERLIESVDLRTSDIDALGLVGGSARIPLVAELIRARTHIPVVVDDNPELTIALGAAQMVDDETSAASVFPVAGTSLPGPAPGGAYRDTPDEIPVGTSAAATTVDSTQTGTEAADAGSAEADDYADIFGERKRSKVTGVLAGGFLATLLVTGIAFGLRSPGDSGNDGRQGAEVVDNAVLPGTTSGQKSDTDEDGEDDDTATAAGRTKDDAEDDEDHEHDDPTTSSKPSTTPGVPGPFPSWPKSSTTRPTPTTRSTSTTTTTSTTSTTTTSTTTTTTTTTTLPDSEA